MLVLVCLVFGIAYLIFETEYFVLETMHMVFGKVYLVFGKVYLVFELLGVALVWGLGLGSMILPASSSSASSCCCWWSPTAVSQAATVASRAAGAEKNLGHCKKSWQRIFYVGFILSQPISNCWSKSLAIVDSSAHVCCINTSFCVHTISSLYLSIIVVFTQTSPGELAFTLLPHLRVSS